MYTIFSNQRPRNLRFSLRRSHFSLNILREPIACSWAPRFFGVYLELELNWKAHIANLENRVIPRINALKAIAGIRWGAHPAVLLTIYKGFIRSVLDWACQIFHPIDDKLLLKMNRLQYASLRAVLGLMRTTPTNVLLDISGEQPLITRWQFLLDKFLCRIIAHKSHPLNSILDSIIQLSEEARPPLGNLVNIIHL